MTDVLRAIVERFRDLRVLVIGDAMLDSYVLGDSTRLCQEAPVPVVAVHERKAFPGGAANTALNLAALGCQVELASVVGADPEGDELRALLRQGGVQPHLLLADGGRRTLSKQRIVNGGQLLARVDHGDTGLISSVLARQLRAGLDAAFVRADAVVISDYSYGVLTRELLSDLRMLQRRFRQIVAVDARDLGQYQTVGVTLVKPNYAEALALAGYCDVPSVRSRPDVAREIAGRVLDVTGAQLAAITLDTDGAVVADRERAAIHVPAKPADQAHTVGAGDTFLAMLTLALAARATPADAAALASLAASVVVQQPGTTTCRAADLYRLLGGSSSAADAARQSSPAHREEHAGGRGTAELGAGEAAAVRPS